MPPDGVKSAVRRGAQDLLQKIGSAAGRNGGLHFRDVLNANP